VNAADAVASITDRARVVMVSSRKEDASVLVAIEDNGPGVEPKNIERIFEPFYTTKSEGMGMGLSICRSIIVSYEGRLFATPNHPCGLIMHISLPTGAAHDVLAVAKEAARS
jgi:C4-dicarboxylate-specific signal transduction histidine kinase